MVFIICTLWCGAFLGVMICQEVLTLAWHHEEKSEDVKEKEDIQVSVVGAVVEFWWRPLFGFCWLSVYFNRVSAQTGAKWLLFSAAPVYLQLLQCTYSYSMQCIYSSSSVPTTGPVYLQLLQCIYNCSRVPVIQSNCTQPPYSHSLRILPLW